MDPEEDLSNVTSPFPEPPSYYLRYTEANLSKLTSSHPPEPDAQGSYSNADGEDVTFPLHELQPPKQEWIVEEGAWEVFGERWPIKTQEETLESMGVPQLFQRKEGTDRRIILRSLLNTLLRTWNELLSSILAGPGLPPTTDVPTINSSDRELEHLRIVAINMHQLLNELRPAQAERQLEEMMRSQIASRRTRIKELKQRRLVIEAELERLEHLLFRHEGEKGEDDEVMLDFASVGSSRSAAAQKVKEKELWDSLLRIADNIPGR
ncbi:hypothetical protein BT69DRAFT_1351976 [Atractiella rhizophila]|nr:hypothetical protein BT69DRAFT_1351976 [Atractiella rhizophila]